MATLETDVLVRTYDGCTLSVVFDTSKYDAATDSYQVDSVTVDNPTGTNGFAARTCRAWAIYKGRYVSVQVPAGSSKTLNITGNRTVADVSAFGLS